jgi:hypothetical protein
LARPSIGWTAGAWLTICAALAAVVAYQLVNSFPLAPTVTAAPPSAPLVELAERPAPPRSPGDDAVEAIAARPLFSADRRPYVPPPTPVEPTVVEVEKSLPLELAGTFLTATDQAALILVAGKPSEWLRSGQSIEGWKIGTIEEDRVQLLKGEQERELRLRDDTAGPERRSPAALTRQPQRESRIRGPRESQRESRMERDQDHVDLRELALGPDDDADLSPNEDGQEPD